MRNGTDLQFAEMGLIDDTDTASGSSSGASIVPVAPAPRRRLEATDGCRNVNQCTTLIGFAPSGVEHRPSAAILASLPLPQREPTSNRPQIPSDYAPLDGRPRSSDRHPA